jgi:hypothetical protein
MEQTRCFHDELMPWTRYVNTSYIAEKYDAFKVLCKVLPELSNHVSEFMGDVVRTPDADFQTYNTYAGYVRYGDDEDEEDGCEVDESAMGDDFKVFIELLPQCVRMVHSISDQDSSDDGDDTPLFYECITAVIFIYTYQFIISDDLTVARENLESLTKRLEVEKQNPLYSSWLDSAFMREFRAWRRWCLRRQPIVAPTV